MEVHPAAALRRAASAVRDAAFCGVVVTLGPDGRLNVSLPPRASRHAAIAAARVMEMSEEVLATAASVNGPSPTAVFLRDFAAAVRRGDQPYRLAATLAAELAVHGLLPAVQPAGGPAALVRVAETAVPEPAVLLELWAAHAAASAALVLAGRCPLCAARLAAAATERRRGAAAAHVECLAEADLRRVARLERVHLGLRRLMEGRA
ncbi:hypothetical protein HRbin39_00643 [bacterium HR39]|nr:hypothetical protein HRbin39_00643 [bacterium HR39]